MANNKILLCLAHMSGQEMKYIQEAFDTNWVVPLGPNVNAFEEDLENTCVVRTSVWLLSVQALLPSIWHLSIWAWVVTMR